MDPHLQARRQVAADRHDAALNAFPRREGAEFQRELRAVIEELTAISTAADTKGSDPVERARTLTWLGSAYFDLGRGIDQQLLSESARCYLLAEELVAEEDSPLFKAKLAFNFANTLRGQSQGLDVGLLEAAEHRYEQAAAAFKSLGQPALAKQAQGNLDTLADSAFPGTRVRGREKAPHQRASNALALVKESRNCSRSAMPSCTG